MENYSIREFKNTDKSDVLKLFTEFGYYLKKLDEKSLDLLILPVDYAKKYYTKMLADVEKKHGKILVIETDHKVIGLIAGIILEIGNDDDEFDCKPHTMGRVIELFISQNYRGQEIGSKLLQKMEEYFKQNDCYKINIEVFAPNESAHKFYQKHRYAPRNIDLAKVL